VISTKIQEESTSTIFAYFNQAKRVSLVLVQYLKKSGVLFGYFLFALQKNCTTVNSPKINWLIQAPNVLAGLCLLPVLDPKCPPFCHSQPKSCSTTTTRNKKILKTCSVLLYSSSDYNLRSKKTKKILFR